MAYELDVPRTMMSYDKFHVSLLKPFFNGGKPVTAPPPAVLQTGHAEDEVESIIEHQGTGKNRHFLLKWKDNGMPLWHAESDIPNCKDLITEYFQRLKLDRQVSAQPSVTKRRIKDKVSSSSPGVAVPSRRSKRLNKGLQNGTILWVP